MRRFISLAIALLIAGFGSSVSFAQPGKLDFADKVRLLSCDPSTSKPCFRVKFNVVDAQGSPLNINLPPNKDLRGKLKVYLDNQEIDPFFAVAQSGDTQAVRGRIALILVDVSGSMNQRMPSGQTRFETAKAALAQFLQGFDPSVDRVAIVPFESHDVANRISSAQFASSSAEALTQISALPTPGPRNNTALYSAVVQGLQVLADQASTASNASGSGAPESLLVVMTDGKNEVGKGDDAGLLDGPAGLQEAANATRSSGVQVIAVGFGDRGSIDQSALRQISTKAYMADSLEKLAQAFNFARTLLTNRIVATFASPWDDRASLQGRTLQVKATLNVSGKKFESDERQWSAPQIGTPSFDGKCDTAELKAALPIVPASGSWLSLLRPVLVFLGLGTMLLVLWFWVPRLVWPEQYIGNFPGSAPDGGMRWANMSRARSSSQDMPMRQAPPGFGGQKGGAQPPRAAGERTVVRPEADFSKSRLQKRPPGGRDY